MTETTTPAKPRRTQAERSAETRARVIEAAVATLSEKGFRSTNLQAIAERAGVTVGAIQHQFGDKAAVLVATIDFGLEEVVADLANQSFESADLTGRVREFIARVWEGYNGPYYQTSIEVLMAMRRDPEFVERAGSAMLHVAEMIDRLWMGTFWDIETDRAVHRSAQRLVFATLNGLALERLVSPVAPDVETDLDALASGVTAIFETHPTGG